MVYASGAEETPCELFARWAQQAQVKVIIDPSTLYKQPRPLIFRGLKELNPKESALIYASYVQPRYLNTPSPHNASLEGQFYSEQMLLTGDIYNTTQENQGTAFPIPGLYTYRAE